MDETKEIDVRWVKALPSAKRIGEMLHQGCKADVEDRNVATDESDSHHRITFKISENDGDGFAVACHSGFRGIIGRCTFTWSRSDVEVSGPGDDTLSGRIVLGDKGECRLKVGDRNLTFWQFRMMALQRLFWQTEQ
jgi:hypothetical protein